MKDHLPRAKRCISFVRILALIMFHALAAAGLFVFTWEAFVIAVISSQLTGYGITVGFHRLLTHFGFKTYTWVRYTLATLGTLALESSPIKWVADHRKHHQFSDKEGDPHSPRHGWFHAHEGWIVELWPPIYVGRHMKAYAPDLQKEWFLRKLHDHYLALNVCVLIVLLVAGFLYGGWYYAASFGLLGFFARIVFVWNVTWSVNSVTHLWGYRNYDTDDDSRNNVLVGLLANGEGWHNNHHAHQQLARHGHRWWEFDASYWFVIWPLKQCRLVWEVRDEIPASRPQ